MVNAADYRAKMTEILDARAAWLEKEEMPRLKEAFRIFHNSFYSIYSLLIRRKLIWEDPYKDEAKITKITIPETAAFPETERAEQMGLRLANFDNQLDFVANFYQFNLDNFGFDRIKRIIALVKYIDWVHFVTAAETNPNTANLAELVNQMRTQKDRLSLKLIGDALNNLNKSTGTIMLILKEINDYNREAFKAEIREKVSAAMPPEPPPRVQAIGKKYAAVAPGRPFYAELAEELIREDYTAKGEALRDKILKQFSLSAEKPADEDKSRQVSYKSYLIDGLIALGSVSAILSEILPKIDANAEVLENSRRNFLQKIKNLLRQLTNAPSENQIYTIEYVDPVRQEQVKEKLNFTAFYEELEQKAKALSNINLKSAVVSKLEGMEETPLLELLEKNSRDIQTMHKLLAALDEYFKAAVNQEDRGRIKGIRPELSAMKNALIKANQKRYEYSSLKEEEEQFKRLGITK
jgi:hypothetical protein